MDICIDIPFVVSRVWG